jgi:hypothetical protein
MSDIDRYKNNAEIINQVVAQIIKDFGMFGLDIYFSGNTVLAYNEIFAQLSVHIAELFANDTQRLWALLYQIDLDQKVISNARADHPDWKNEDVIAELLIHRELKKVLFRNFHKHHPDKI